MLSNGLKKKVERLLDEMIPLARNYIEAEKKRQVRVAAFEAEMEAAGEPPPGGGIAFIPGPPTHLGPPLYLVAQTVRDWLQAAEIARRLGNDGLAVDCTANAVRSLAELPESPAKS